MARIIHDFMYYNQNVEKNIADRMRASLSPEELEFLQRISESAAMLGMPLYVVGGYPRDLLLGYPQTDFDLVVEGKAELLAQSLASSYGGKVIVHSRFGTAKWSLPETSLDLRATGRMLGRGDKRSFDFVSARSETYKHPAALPTIKPGTITDDLRRRDFSINALAVRLDGSHFGDVHDEMGAWEDIQRRTIRVLHIGSFIDDPTRMYRAARYEQRYGFMIESHTLELMPAARALIEKLSPQRIRHELDLILDEQHAAAILRRLEEHDLLKPIHEALSFDANAENRISKYESPVPEGLPAWPAREVRWLLWLMPLSLGDLDAVNRRLHFTAPQFKALTAVTVLAAELQPDIQLSPSRWVQRLDEIPLIGIYVVGLVLPPSPTKAAIEKFLKEWRLVRPSITGHDLMKLGMTQGSVYGSILATLRYARLDGKIHSDEEEREYLHALLRKQPK